MYFCSLFDKNYLTRALAMYYSLKKNADNFHLYFFAMDDTSYKILNILKLENVTTIFIENIEDDKLKKIKSERSKVEYYWTCTPVVTTYCLQNFKINHVTYLDADLFFYNNPKILLEEMGDKTVLITEHLYSPHYFRSEIFGKYCVQFVSFKNDESALKVLNEWKNNCLNWCFDKIENGKFGDQKYLDSWTNDYVNVHSLRNYGGLLAPWNIQQFKIYDENGILMCKNILNNKKYDVVFYHFHFVRYYDNALIDIGDYYLNENVKKYFYNDYINVLEKILNELKIKYPDLKLTNCEKVFIKNYETKINRLKRYIKMTLNVQPLSKFILKHE